MGLSNSDWHKDVRGKQLKLMIYLTNVTSKDSYFSFFPKTHSKKTFDFKLSRFSKDQVNNLITCLKTLVTIKKVQMKLHFMATG